MNLAAWAERNGVAWVTAYRWFRAGLLPVPARRVGRLIRVDEPAGMCGRAAVYARVSSANLKADLDRRVARATTRQIPVDVVVTEVGSALNGHRRRFLALLRDPSFGPRLYGNVPRLTVPGAPSTLAPTARRRDGAF
jgi:predicted site-specific integrase-resolvase